MFFRNRVFRNFLYLLTTQLSNFVLPIITLPYLVRILGPEKYGLLAFAQSLNQYFLIVQDYGFNLTATRDISKNRDDREKISRIFSSVTTIKLFLLSLSFCVLATIIFFFEHFSENKIVFLSYYLVVVGQGLFPVWFFQGIEEMKYITSLDLASKTIATVSVFIFITTTEDFYFVPIIYGIGSIVTAITAMLIVKYQFKIKYERVSIAEIIEDLRKGFNVFLAELAGGLYHNTTIFLLGITTSNVLVGFYAATTKILNALISILYVISRAFYPHIAQKKDNFRFFMYAILSAGLFMSVAVLISNSIIVDLMLGSQFVIVKGFLSILSFSLFFAALYICFGTNWLLVNGKDYVFRNIIYINSLLGIAITYYLMSQFELVGAVFGLLITRGLFAISSTLVYLKHSRSDAL